MPHDPGFDLAIRRSLAKKDATHDWGLEVGADFASSSERTSGTGSIPLRVLTDTYQLGGVVPQPAPYSGRFSPLPGDQRIGDTPTRAITTATGTVTGTRAFKQNTTLFRLGAWIELLPAKVGTPQSESDHWSVLVRGGPAYITTHGNFSLNEQIQLTGFVTPVAVSASADGSDSELCWFAGARVRRTFNENWALQGWGDYVHGSLFTLSGGVRTLTFDTRQSLLLGLALEYRK